MPQWLLKPLFFEVPQRDPNPVFIGRQWLYGEILEHLASELPTNRGVIVTGSPGTGKTALALKLVEMSCFGKGAEPIYQGREQVGINDCSLVVCSLLTDMRPFVFQSLSFPALNLASISRPARDLQQCRPTINYAIWPVKLSPITSVKPTISRLVWCLNLFTHSPPSYPKLQP